jgi:predicted DNA-binding transcriptional regulator AlpA
MPKQKETKYLSVPEAADVLGVSDDTVLRWCRSEIVFPNVVVKNPYAQRTRFRIPESDVLAVKERLNEPVFS